MKKTKQFLLGFLMVNLFWFLMSALLSMKALPGPIAVYSQFHKVLGSGLFWHLLASLYRIGMGLLISFVIGISAGLFMASVPGADKLLNPIVYFSYPVPKTALLPVAMLLSGLGDGSKIAILVMTTVFQVIIAVRDARMEIDLNLYHTARAAGAGRLFMFRHITLPALLPELFTSLRIGTGTSLAVLFVIEAYGTRKGIGYYILDSWSRIAYIEMYGGIVIISLLGAVLFLLLDLLYYKVCRWKQAE